MKATYVNVTNIASTCDSGTIQNHNAVVVPQYLAPFRCPSNFLIIHAISAYVLRVYETLRTDFKAVSCMSNGVSQLITTCNIYKSLYIYTKIGQVPSKKC